VDVALGLVALHDCNILHGDIKCENIIIREHEERGIIAKITDFGGTADMSDPKVHPTHCT
jgi:serine/threonine protein kinase